MFYAPFFSLQVNNCGIQQPSAVNIELNVGKNWFRQLKITQQSNILLLCQKIIMKVHIYGEY